MAATSGGSRQRIGDRPGATADPLPQNHMSRRPMNRRFVSRRDECARGELNQRDLTLKPAKIAVLSVKSGPVASRWTPFQVGRATRGSTSEISVDPGEVRRMSSRISRLRPSDELRTSGNRPELERVGKCSTLARGSRCVEPSLGLGGPHPEGVRVRLRLDERQVHCDRQVVRRHMIHV